MKIWKLKEIHVVDTHLYPEAERRGAGDRFPPHHVAWLGDTLGAVFLLSRCVRVDLDHLFVHVLKE